MRTNSFLFPLLAAGIMAAPVLHAQTYFYINGIAVQPAAPTDQDAVQLLLNGDLSNTGSSVTGATVQVNGFNVALTVSAQSDGGLDVLVAHTETVPVGTLAAGTYTVTINGGGVLDSAPAPEHQFTVSGGAATACDSLIIASVTWAPFDDTTLLLHVFNPTSELFDYPAFVLLDAGGDTLAKETVNFFGIAQESWHVLAIEPGATIPDGPFTGTLELWELFHAELSCTWNTSFDLCPPEPCASFNPQIANTGKEAVSGVFPYTIRHGGEPVASGTFELGSGSFYDSDSVCLPPGHYLMEVFGEQPVASDVVRFGVGIDGVVSGPAAYVVSAALSAVPFDLFAPCISGTQGIAARQSAGMTVASGPGFVEVARSDGRALGELQVFDAQGRRVARVAEFRERHRFSTAHWAPGLYVLRGQAADGRVLGARAVVE